MMAVGGDGEVIQYELLEGGNGYWERRERGDWQDMPNLWGPFDEN